MLVSCLAKGQVQFESVGDGCVHRRDHRVDYDKVGMIPGEKLGELRAGPMELEMRRTTSTRNGAVDRPGDRLAKERERDFQIALRDWESNPS